MSMLLIIVVLAVFAVWLSNRERKHPAALITLGLLTVILGGRAVALLSDSYSDQYLGTLYAEEENLAVASPPSEGEHGVEGENSEPDVSEIGRPTDDVTLDPTSISSSDTPRELTVEPSPRIRYLTTPRPNWIETAASTHDGRYQIAVDSGLHVRKRTAEQMLREEVKTAVDKYVNDYLGSELASTLSGYSIRDSEQGGTRTISLRLEGKAFEIADERFDEQVEFDYGVMNQSHALIEIDQDVQKALDQRWSKVRATSRLFQTALGAGAILFLLGTMFSYLKLDTATRGYYTGRLQFGAAAAILAIIAAGVVFANRIPWM